MQIRGTTTLVAFLILAVLAAAGCAPAAPAAAPTAAPTKAAPAATPTAPPQPAAAATPTQPAKPSPVAEKPLDPPVLVKHGSLAASAGNIGVYIALDRGYYKEQGLNVELVPFKTSSEVVPAVATGEIQTAGFAPNAGLFNAVLRGITPRFAATVTKQEARDKSSALVLRKDIADQKTIKDFADLKGKTIAATGMGTGSTYEIFVNLALKKGGLTVSDVKLENLGFPDMITGLGGKALDAAILQEPLVTQAAEQGVGVPWKWAGEVLPAGLQGLLITYSPQFTSGNPEAARRWMLAHLKGVRDYVDAIEKGKDKQQILQIVAKYLNISDVSIVDRANPWYMDTNGIVSPADFADHIGFSFDKGYIKEKPDITPLVDRQWVDYALDKLGKR